MRRIPALRGGQHNKAEWRAANLSENTFGLTGEVFDTQALESKPITATSAELQAYYVRVHGLNEAQRLLLRSAQYTANNQLWELIRSPKAFDSADAFENAGNLIPGSVWRERRAEFEKQRLTEAKVIWIIRTGREYHLDLEESECRRLELNNRRPSFDERLAIYKDSLTTLRTKKLLAFTSRRDTYHEDDASACGDGRFHNDFPIGGFPSLSRIDVDGAEISLKTSANSIVGSFEPTPGREAPLAKRGRPRNTPKDIALWIVIARNLQAARTEKHLTHDQLSEQLDVSREAISRHLRGTTAAWGRLPKYLQILKATPEQIFAGISAADQTALRERLGM